MSDNIIQFGGNTIKPAELKSTERAQSPEIEEGDFDFSYWSKLAKKDPDAFETAREAEIQKHITSLDDATAQARMRSLQWRVDMERDRSASPLDAASRIYSMMWESVGRNIEVLDELAALLNPDQKTNVKPQTQARKNVNTVVAFKRKEMEVAIAD